jgi:hypothetical protein
MMSDCKEVQSVCFNSIAFAILLISELLFEFLASVEYHHKNASARFIISKLLFNSK